MNEHDITAKWVKKAAIDLQSADVLLGAGIASNSCYFSQQAGEKILKGYLSTFTDEIPRTHNVGQLCRQCMDNDASFSEILRISTDLTEFATATRYPGGVDLSKEDAEEAIQKAGRIFVFTQNHMELLEQDFDEEPDFEDKSDFDEEPEQSGPTMRMSF